MRRRSLVAVAVPLTLSLGLLASPATAADPPEGTLDSKHKKVEWDGPALVVAANPSPQVGVVCSGLPSVMSCDEFTLTVNVSASQYSGSGGVAIDITWSTVIAGIINDYDLYVYDEAGEEVASSAQGGTTEEHVFIPRASGTYTVTVVEFGIVNDQYHGIAVAQGVKKKK
jgi:hypothetical protein